MGAGCCSLSGSLIHNLQVSHLERLAPSIPIVCAVVIILDPSPYVLEPLDRRRILLSIIHEAQSLEKRRRRRFNVDVIARPDKVKQAQPVPTQLIRRRTHDPMRRRFEIRRGPEIERVAHIAHDASVHGRHIAPRALRRLDLQARDVLRPEERQGPEIRVRAGPRVVDLRVVGGGPWVVQHVPQVVVAGVVVAVALGEEVLGQFEDGGEEDEDLLGYAQCFLLLWCEQTIHRLGEL